MRQGDLTEKKAKETLRNFFREKPFLFFGSGMSCALDRRLGMDGLKNALISQMDNRDLTDLQVAEWTKVKAGIENGLDLESALNSVDDQSLIRIITEITGTFIALLDKENAFRIAKGETHWPAIKLIKKLVETLPEGDRKLHVLTPNYDMLFEYSCDFTGISYTNGFWGGVERKSDWQAVDRALLVPLTVYSRKASKKVWEYKNHVRLYKVHGSINYFFHRNAVVENNAWMWCPPDSAERVMITPGLSKYETLQRYRNELLKSADSAIDRSNHFLFLGYGFNDTHLEEYIKRKLITQSCKGLIITRDSNPRIQQLLSQATNLWLVCKSDEAHSEGTRIFNKQFSGWLNLPGHKLWDIAEFTTYILGG